MKKLVLCTLVFMMLVGIGLAVYAQGMPPAPVLTSPAAGASVPGAEITFRWETSAGATDYWLSVFKVGDIGPFFSEAVGLTTEKTVPGFPDDGSTYGWSVAAGNDSGWTAADPVYFVNGAAAPIPPQTTLNTPSDLSNVGGTEITFSWNPSTGAIGYWLTVQSLPDGAFYFNEYVGAFTEKTIDFPDDGTTYGWSVAAGGLSGWSDAAVPFTFANTDAPVAPAAPVLITPADGAIVSGGTEIYFEWTASSGALGYWLVVWDESDGTSIFDGYVHNHTSLIVNGPFADGNSYSWYVAAGNFGGYTASDPRSFTKIPLDYIQVPDSAYSYADWKDNQDGSGTMTIIVRDQYNVPISGLGLENFILYDIEGMGIPFSFINDSPDFDVNIEYLSPGYYLVDFEYIEDPYEFGPIDAYIGVWEWDDVSSLVWIEQNLVFHITSIIE